MTWQNLSEDLADLFSPLSGALSWEDTSPEGTAPIRLGRTIPLTTRYSTHRLDVPSERYRDPTQRRRDRQARDRARNHTRVLSGYYRDRYQKRKAEGWFDRRTWAETHCTPEARARNREACRVRSAQTYAELNPKERSERNRAKREQRDPNKRKAEQARYYQTLAPDQKRIRQEQQNARRREKTARARLDAQCQQTGIALHECA